MPPDPTRPAQAATGPAAPHDAAAPAANAPTRAAAPGDAPGRHADGSAELLRRTLPLMSRHAAGYSPDSYALWYEYVRGGNPALRDEIDSLVRRCERLSPEVTFEMHQKHVADRAEETIRRSGTGLLELVHTMRSSVKAASSDASEFDAQLAAFDEVIASAGSVADVRQHVDTMRDDVGRMNRSLTALNDRLESSHQEVSRLQGELKSAREEASLDPLSGIRNRRGFDIELLQLCRASTESGVPFTLVMFDIDLFKRVNDTYGHPFGDQVIRGVAQALAGMTQRQDVAARYGGEEFALLLPDTPLSGGRDVAERIRAAIARGHIKRGNGEAPITNITLSAGVAQHVSGEDPTSLVTRADRALYASKQAGRNRVTVDG